MELEKLKAAEELAGCTFKPQLVSKNTPSIGKKGKPSVSNYTKDHSKYEVQKKKREMKDCTFQPTIDQKSSRMAQQ